jgi:hypothetical protein
MWLGLIDIATVKGRRRPPHSAHHSEKLAQFVTICIQVTPFTGLSKVALSCNGRAGSTTVQPKGTPSAKQVLCFQVSPDSITEFNRGFLIALHRGVVGEWSALWLACKACYDDLFPRGLIELFLLSFLCCCGLIAPPTIRPLSVDRSAVRSQCGSTATAPMTLRARWCFSRSREAALSLC